MELRMAKRVENSNSRYLKSIVKSPSKQSSNEKTHKSLSFNLEPEYLSGPSEGSTYSPSKKRKREFNVPKDIEELEEEIEKQLDLKAEKSNLTVVNVKNILRSVITNKYVVDMLRQTVEEGGVTDVPFGPKLTRAKTKELIQQNPESALSPVVGFLTPVKADASEINPDMKLLMDKEIPEDSSDEEYNPENEEEPSDDEDKGDASLASDLDSMPPTPAPLTPLQDLSQDGFFKVPQENVGQRTRSKLNLNRLPLESLEQAFVPPDVTNDMYEPVCDNPDWNEFLKEFTQPLNFNETLEDDPDNDPEYNILEDEEVEKVEDREEMRKDRAVKVSKRELNALMAELFEYTDNLTSDEEDTTQTPENIAALEKSIMKETEDRRKREELETEKLRKMEELVKKKKHKRGFVPIQICLLQQQLQQHVQLITQHFLQTYQHPRFYYYANYCKTMLNTLSGLRTDKICKQEIYNLDAAIDTVSKWEETLSIPDKGDEIRKFVRGQLEIEKVKKKRKKNASTKFPEEMMRLLADSEVILYPRMLPPLPFRTTLLVTGPSSFTPSEDISLII